MLYLTPILVILAIYLGHLVRGYRLRKRVTRWAENREHLSDEAFCIALNLPAIRRDAAISVREMVSDAVRIPKELIGPNDTICELEKVGDPSHPSAVDYFEDMWSVASPKNEAALVTVRDFVIEFGPQMK
jgi:hypothetical protein